MIDISIITTSYNYDQYISETIESVLAQTYSNWEMIIFDDGSSDNSLEIIQSYCNKDSRIKLYTHPNNENKGLITTLKAAIEKAEGKYIVFLESDDYITPDYLEEKIQVFNNEEVGLVYNNFEFAGDYKNYGLEKLRKEIITKWSKKPLAGDISEWLLLKNYIPTFSIVMLKKETLKDLNYNSPKPESIDWWLWIQIASKYKIGYISKPLTYWRMHKDSYLQREKPKISLLEDYKFSCKICKLNRPELFWKYHIVFFALYLYRRVKKLFFR